MKLFSSVIEKPLKKETKPDPQHDYAGYEKSLEKILEGVTKDYWNSYIHINRHQVNVGKTYLWVSAALIGAYSAAYDKFHHLIFNHAYTLVIGIISFCLSCVAFGICLYAIPARKGYKAIPNKGWGEFSAEAYNLLKGKSQQVYSSFLTSHIAKIDKSFAYNFKTNQDRAKLLRVTSWLLIFSFIAAIFVATSISIETLIKPKNIETSEMNPENKQDPVDAQLDVPEPPPPADIGGGIVSTHSVDNSEKGSVFITENLEEKKQ